MATKHNSGKKIAAKRNNTIGLMIQLSPDIEVSEDLVLEAGIEDTTGLNIACECSLCKETAGSTGGVKSNKPGFFKRIWNKVFKA